MTTRAERRRLERGAYAGPAGSLCCKFCKSARGTFIKAGNAFECQTDGCKGNPATKRAERLLLGDADAARMTVEEKNYGNTR